MSVIQTNGLSKSFNGVDALKDLTLSVPKNSIFGFLGPNGAGKTTTMKLLLGLINPSSGTGTVFGQDIVRDSVDIRSRVGYLPQDPKFYKHMTARQILDFTARFYFRGPKAEIDNRITEVLELVGLSDKADRPTKGFSGGESQRLGIAQAQVNYPDLLILDEPAASLDPLGRRDVLEVMERLQEHTTIFYSTHILDDVQQVSDIVAILNKGELVAHGQIEELLSGSSGAVVFSVVIEGDAATARTRLANQGWVSEVTVIPKDEQNQLLVHVTDEAMAQRHLLRLLLSDESLVISKYGRRQYELEEIFINIVEGGSHGS